MPIPELDRVSVANRPREPAKGTAGVAQEMLKVSTTFTTGRGQIATTIRGPERPASDQAVPQSASGSTRWSTETARRSASRRTWVSASARCSAEMALFV